MRNIFFDTWASCQTSDLRVDTNHIKEHLRYKIIKEIEKAPERLRTTSMADLFSGRYCSAMCERLGREGNEGARVSFKCKTQARALHKVMKHNRWEHI